MTACLASLASITPYAIGLYIHATALGECESHGSLSITHITSRHCIICKYRYQKDKHTLGLNSTNYKIKASWTRGRGDSHR